MNIISIIKDIGVSGIFDILLITLLAYSILVWFKKTKAAFVLTGILIIAVIYLISREFNLYLTSTIFEAFFAVFLISIVVIFQEELRYIFERLALWSLNRRITRRRTTQVTRLETETLVRTLFDLAKEKVGALIVLRGKDLIIRQLQGGVPLNGLLSEDILKSIFDPNSLGHDGAVVIEKDQIVSLGCYLPLSKDMKKVGHAGTRHAAALGLSEVSDACCLVVSEEKGTISIVQKGEMTVVEDPDALTRKLEQFYKKIYPKKERKSLAKFFKRNSREKVIALVLSVALWFVLVDGSKLIYKTYQIPVEYTAFPGGYELQALSPKEVEVSFSGPRRAFYFLRKNRIKLFLKSVDLNATEQTIVISNADVVFPSKNVSLQDVEPRRVSIEIQKGNRDQEAENREK